MKFAIFYCLLAAAVSSAAYPPSKNDAKSKYMSKLLSKAVKVRERELNNEDHYPVDISSYSVQFQKCQSVRSFDDDLADDHGSTTVLGTTRFAIFRLCPNNCADECKYNYGEYILDLESYLELTAEYFQEKEENMCHACKEQCANNNNNNNRKLSKNSRFLQESNQHVDCLTCLDYCQKIENMEENGYIDATEFLECTMIYQDQEDDGISRYAAPICASDGAKINIAVFSDERCQEYVSEKKVEDYIEPDDEGNLFHLSYALLKMTYRDTCISCKEVKDYGNDSNRNNDAWDSDEVLEFCENLYDMAGKCEYAHGLDNGYFGVEGFENQKAQEHLVCQFIKDLREGTYDEKGEIDPFGSSFSIDLGYRTTSGQKFALAFFVLGTTLLAVYAAVLHFKYSQEVYTTLPSSGPAQHANIDKSLEMMEGDADEKAD